MSSDQPITILCVTSYEKGQDFLRACKALGCTVYLLTVEKLRKGNWPREAIDEMFFMPEELPLQDLLNAVSYAARSRKIDRIVALDEFDLERPGSGGAICSNPSASVPCSKASSPCWHAPPRSG